MYTERIAEQTRTDNFVFLHTFADDGLSPCDLPLVSLSPDKWLAANCLQMLLLLLLLLFHSDADNG